MFLFTRLQIQMSAPSTVTRSFHSTRSELLLLSIGDEVYRKKRAIRLLSSLFLWPLCGWMRIMDDICNKRLNFIWCGETCVVSGRHQYIPEGSHVGDECSSCRGTLRAVVLPEGHTSSFAIRCASGSACRWPHNVLWTPRIPTAHEKRTYSRRKLIFWLLSKANLKYNNHYG